MGYGNATAIWATLSRRGEMVLENRDQRIDLRRLYRGHQIDIGEAFRISPDGGANSLELTAAIEGEQPGHPERAATFATGSR